MQHEKPPARVNWPKLRMFVQFLDDDQAKILNWIHEENEPIAGVARRLCVSCDEALAMEAAAPNGLDPDHDQEDRRGAPGLHWDEVTPVTGYRH